MGRAAQAAPVREAASIPESQDPHVWTAARTNIHLPSGSMWVGKERGGASRVLRIAHGPL